MTTPAFNHLISINTDTGLSVEHHLGELQQVATDLRNERELGAPPPRRPNRVRMAVGSALLNIGSALVASPSRRSVQAR
jgi:hypothetical protein